MSKPDLKIVELDVANRRDPAAFLRQIADAIDDGAHGDVGTIAVVVLGDTLEIYGGGTSYDATDVAACLNAGALRMVRAVERHGRKDGDEA